MVGKTYSLTFAYNARTGNTPHLQAKVGDTVVFEEDVTAVGGGNAYRTKTVTFVASETSAQITFAQTATGDQAVLLDDIRLVGESVSLPCLTMTPKNTELVVGQSTVASITIPAQLVATGPATIKVVSSDNSVATLTGAGENGELVLTFPTGEPPTQSFEILTHNRGAATIDVSDAAGLCVDNSIKINVIGSFVRNPSFESNPAGGFPGYGAIDAWIGGSGLNNGSGPFHDNGAIPDRSQVAFLQNSGELVQQILNLTPGKNYWLQFHYNVRNCCGGSMDLSASFFGVEVLSVAGLSPVGGTSDYSLAQASFVPTVEAGALAITGTASGDASLLIDGVTIVQRDVGGIVVENPSFEASGLVAFPGYIQPDRLSGWVGVGQYGVNTGGRGPFADNGANPDQDSVAFLQGKSSLSQVITGLTPGESYVVAVAANSRTGNAPHLRISADGAAILDVDVVAAGGNNPYVVQRASFVATDVQATIKLEQTVDGDQTMLLDNVLVTPGAVAPRVSLGVTRLGDGTIRLSWPSTAVGYVLQATTTVNAGWADVGSPVVVDGGNNTVTVTAGQAAGFFRLKK